MAYYMAVRGGVRSLMDPHHSTSAQLPPEILQTAIEGLVTLREMELKETHRLIMPSRNHWSLLRCISYEPVALEASDMKRHIIDQITGPSQSGTRILQVIPLDEVSVHGREGFCHTFVGWWESEHTEARKKAWVTLPSVFGLKA